jgi:uncharacterized protein with HEPN domain
MFDAAREALAFVAQRDRADLDHDRMLVLALMKDIEIIGEAANQISESAWTKLPNIPWSDIIGMRHRMVHAYFEINLDILWQTVRSDLPHLLETLEQYMDEGNG